MQRTDAATTHGEKHITSAQIPFGKRLMIMGALASIASSSAVAHNVEVLQKLVAAKEAAAENKQKLHQYQWIETTQLTLKGDAFVSKIMPVRSRWTSSEDPDRSSTGTTQRWQNATMNH